MRAFCLIIVLIALPFATAVAEATGVVIVRHAEKADDGSRDPELTRAGRQRAESLANALGHARVSELIASQYRRTRQTLAVLARRRGLDVSVVPAESGAIEDHIEAIVEKVKESSAEGLIVIAGHSNTVPLIVEALSGSVVSPIGESDYDRLYLLVPSASGMDVIESRYGPSP
ncbi:SixA phosphatase family protein [Wenzhouxiangella sediminis]|jgi:phosphohistidine phosphatase SixA|uniref:Histidine phosphatase family protein n=1 Tax=Wenzhouxiangella sediminis TaxID=1792836 RepID=A0A3E1K6E5_9GAMM|nr:phosphoglycerate mutase family protein [Wenzhouxiangella sediminis]RFF29530.1 histidine phosphatase family protein [Wenzhouxiangella sediminis]